MPVPSLVRNQTIPTALAAEFGDQSVCAFVLPFHPFDIEPLGSLPSVHVTNLDEGRKHDVQRNSATGA